MLKLDNGAWLLSWPSSWDQWREYQGEWGLTDDTLYRALALGYWSPKECGVRLFILSGRRSRSSQAALYAAYERGARSLPAAPPGTSAHEVGEAFDVGSDFRLSSSAWECVGALGQALGLVWGGTFSTPDRPHFQLATFQGGAGASIS